MKETIADAERQARRALERMDKFLGDDQLGSFGRMMAERAKDQATYILEAIARGDDIEAWRVRGLLFNSLGLLGEFTPGAVRGRKFKPKRTIKAVTAHQERADDRRQKVLELARVLVKDGHGRMKNDRINATALAKKCVESGPRFCPVKLDSAVKIIREALKDRKLQ